MDEQGNSQHINSSLTDLMTSLMVIFILLLLVFVHLTAGVGRIRDELLKTLRGDLSPQGFSEKNIQPDKKDRTAILVIVPDNLMNFEIGQSTLKPEGEAFLRTRIPVWQSCFAAQNFASASSP